MNYTRRQFNTLALAAGCSSFTCWPIAARAQEKAEVSWLTGIQQPVRPVPENATPLSPLLVTDKGRPIAKLDAWKIRREQLRKSWEEFLRPLDVKRKPPKLTVLKEDRPGGVIRQLVRYESEPGLPVEGYLLKPQKKIGPRPGVAVFHSTVKHTIRQPAGVQGKPEKAFGLKLAQRGYVAFCPRCFLWQGPGSYQNHVKEFHKRHPQSKGMAKMLFDAVRAVDVLESLPEVDAMRIGAVGHSLGAKEVLYLAAFDERVKVTVSSEGGIGIGYSNWDAPWYLGKTVHEKSFQRQHHELLALAAPRPFLLIGGNAADGDRSWPYIEAVLPVYDLYKKPRRVGLLNHKQGHAVPPLAEKRIYEWFAAYLRG